MNMFMELMIRHEEGFCNSLLEKFLTLLELTVKENHLIFNRSVLNFVLIKFLGSFIRLFSVAPMFNYFLPFLELKLFKSPQGKRTRKSPC